MVDNQLQKLYSIPKRVFLDSCTLQTLQDYGEFIYDGGQIPDDDQIWLVPELFEEVRALHEIMLVAQRAHFEFALSRNSLSEVTARNKHDYLQWAFEMIDYWESCLNLYRRTGPFTGRGKILIESTNWNSFGYLSRKDLALIKDAILFECSAFLTIERKLAKNTSHLEKMLGLKILRPLDFWYLLRPWAPLIL